MCERPRVLQFQIRTVLLVVAMVSVCLGARGLPENYRTMGVLCALGTVVAAVALIRRRFWLALIGCLVVAIAIPVQQAVNCAPSRFEIWLYLDRCWSYLGVPGYLRTMAVLCVVGAVIAVAALIRRRFWLALIGCLVVAIAIPVQTALNAPASVDNSPLNVPVLVVDSLTGKGIPGAAVQGGHDKGPLAKSDSSGYATVSWTVSEWRSSPIVCACAQGYEAEYLNIADRINWSFFRSPTVRPVLIQLKKEKSANTDQPHSPASQHQPAAGD